MLGQIGETNRSSRADHQSEDTVAPRQISNERTLLRIHPIGGKALEEPAIWCQDSNRSVPRPDDCGGHLHYAPKYPLKRYLGDQR